MQRFKLTLTLMVMLATALMGTGCVTIKTEHEIKPIEINLNVKLQHVEEDLDDFFEDLDEASSTL